MTTIYDEMAAIALDLLAEFGVDVTVTTRGATTYDETAGKATQATTNHTMRLVFKQQSTKAEGASAVAANRKEAIISGTDTSGASVTIYVDDEVKMADGTIYKVVDPGPVAPSGVPVVYDAILEA